MTVLQQTPFNAYNASGVSVRFAFTFRILENTHLQVELDGVRQTQGADYTLENVTNVGGDVVFTVAPTAGVVVSLLRVTPVDQMTDYNPFDPFPAETHELALDKLTMIYQERIVSGSTTGLPLHPSGAYWDAQNLTIDNLPTPTLTGHAANKAYVDAQIGNPFDPTQDQIITGNWQFDGTAVFNGVTTFNAAANFTVDTAHTGDVVLDDSRIRGLDSVGTAQSMVYLSRSSDRMFFGDTDVTSVLRGLDVEIQHGGSTVVAETKSRADGSFIVRDRAGEEKKAGFRNPKNYSVTDVYTITLDDEEAIIRSSGSSNKTWTLGDTEEGFNCRVIRTGSGNVQLLRGSLANCRLLDGSGVLKELTTGVNVARSSIVEIFYTGTSAAYIFGNGLTEI